MILAGLFHPERYTEQTALDPRDMVARLRELGKEAEYIPKVEDIVENLVEHLRGGEVVLVMSNGGFGGIHQKLLDALAAR